jgi:hypothetical protein
MRKPIFSLVLVGLFVPASFAAAQQANSGWSAVEALNAGTTVHVIGRSHSTVCKVAKVDDASLTCMSVGPNAGQAFQKADIKKIKIPHHGRSTLTGLALGGGAGAGIGAGVGTSLGTTGNGIVTTGEFAGAGAAFFGLIGALIGGLTDFTATTIYKG